LRSRCRRWVLHFAVVVPAACCRALVWKYREGKGTRER
jgi:hypothetical protein